MQSAIRYFILPATLFTIGINCISDEITGERYPAKIAANAALDTLINSDIEGSHVRAKIPPISPTIVVLNSKPIIVLSASIPKSTKRTATNLAEKVTRKRRCCQQFQKQRF